MNPMTLKWLTIWLADEFHDWVDGDDCVVGYKITGNTIVVRFESGGVFHIQISQLEE